MKIFNKKNNFTNILKTKIQIMKTTESKFFLKMFVKLFFFSLYNYVFCFGKYLSLKNFHFNFCHWGSLYGSMDSLAYMLGTFFLLKINFIFIILILRHFFVVGVEKKRGFLYMGVWMGGL